MKNVANVLSTLLVITIITSCNQINEKEISIIPFPSEIENHNGYFTISNTTELVVSDESLLPLADMLNQQIDKLAGFELEIVAETQSPGSIHLQLSDDIAKGEYGIRIDDELLLQSANFEGLTRAGATLIQLMKQKTTGLKVPKLDITDSPDYPYQAVLLDLARFWNPIETIKETINLLWFYKVRYLHLHLSDNRRFTLPMDEFPDLKTITSDGSREYYTEEELRDLVEYARIRGIAIIPEIDLPGHSSQLWSKYPDIFGSIDPNTKKPMSLYVINMAKEETYEACEKIVNRLADIFYTSPYIHFGGDEVYLEVLKKAPEYEPYCRKHQLTEALQGDPNELFCHFINRMDQMVRATGKQSIIWEGFHGKGAGKEIIPNDIPIIVWNTTYNHPDTLLKHGFQIINSTWIPWYMVGAMNFAPAPEKGYDWDLHEWRHWNDRFADVTIEPNEATLGGQICFWEQNHYKVIPILRDRVPILAERLWNNELGQSYEDYLNRFEQTDQRYWELFRPVDINASGLLSLDEQTFDQAAELELVSEIENTVLRYVVSDDWKMPDMDQADIYSQKISIDNSAVITVQVFDQNGERIGFPVQEYFRKIEPYYQYELYGPAPNTGWPEMPDFDTLPLVREGVTGRMTPERLQKINGELFAKVKREGHIETRFKDVYNQYAVKLSGSLKLEAEQEIELLIQTHDGLAHLYVDDVLVAEGSNFNNQSEEFALKLSGGVHSFFIKYYYRQIQNQLSILYKTADMEDFESFENILIPLE